MKIIDFHAHAFPDDLAERAIAAVELLSAREGAKALLDGKVSSLLRSMDAAGIEATVVASIATRPKQFASVLRWSKEIASDRIVPFASLHPADPEAVAQVRAIAAEGLQGLKLHPYYQEFDLVEPQMWPIYEAIQDSGLILLCHTGFDFAFPRLRRCDPARVRKVVEAFPSLKLVTSHIGGWQDWAEVRKRLLGKPVYMEISYSLAFLSAEEARGLLLAHPQDYLLFGSDSPWGGQAATLAQLRALGLGLERESALLEGNARRLLGREGL